MDILFVLSDLTCADTGDGAAAAAMRCTIFVEGVNAIGVLARGLPLVGSSYLAQPAAEDAETFL